MNENTNNSPFIGCTIVATGKMVNFTHSSINSKIASLGATAGSSVTKCFQIQRRRFMIPAGKSVSMSASMSIFSTAGNQCGFCQCHKAE